MGRTKVKTDNMVTEIVDVVVGEEGLITTGEIMIIPNKLIMTMETITNISINSNNQIAFRMISQVKIIGIIQDEIKEMFLVIRIMTILMTGIFLLRTPIKVTHLTDTTTITRRKTFLNLVMILEAKHQRKTIILIKRNPNILITE